MTDANKLGTIKPVHQFHKTASGRIFLGDSRALFQGVVEPGSVDLIMTSPPFGLVRKKDYGNVDAHEYLEWFRPFAEAFFRALKPRGSLDVAALRVLNGGVSRCQIINVPRLHAKVYVADESYAIITSANLTPSGLDIHLEYGIGASDPVTIRSVRHDLELYATLGSPLTAQTIDELEAVSNELRGEFQAIERSAEKRLGRKFNETLRKADYQFLRAQVGTRSSHGLFADAMLYLLSLRAMTTRELHRKLKELLPELCDDTTELVVNGQHFGKKWKHVVRNAQVFLRSRGSIQLIGKEWPVKVS